MPSLSSKAIREVEYDPGSGTLAVFFNDGSVYSYFNVPQVVYETLLRAGSPGSFFNRDVRNDYQWTRT